MLRPLAAAVLVCLTGALVAVVPSGGSAAKAAARGASGEPFPSIPLRAGTQRGGFTGRLDVTRVRSRGDQLIASGALTGRLRDRRYPSTQPVNVRRFSVVLAVSPTPGADDCASLAMATSAVRTRLVGLRAEVHASNFDVRPTRGGPRAVRDILCAASQTLTAQPPAVGVAPSPVLVHLLNALRLVHS